MDPEIYSLNRGGERVVDQVFIQDLAGIPWAELIASRAYAMYTNFYINLVQLQLLKRRNSLCCEVGMMTLDIFTSILVEDS